MPSAPGLRKVAVGFALVVGGAVAILVPIFFAVMLWGFLRGGP
ncbi:MAG TPA: hypothetical protein VLS93_04035 [Anaeromyxobacteraceae bacterium]|nr:hypothetical protein [Anaeromyxobacteraceae bacterium]